MIALVLYAAGVACAAVTALVLRLVRKAARRRWRFAVCGRLARTHLDIALPAPRREPPVPRSLPSDGGGRLGTRDPERRGWRLSDGSFVPQEETDRGSSAQVPRRPLVRPPPTSMPSRGVSAPR